MKTINHALDSLLSFSENRDLNKYPDLLILKQNLVEMKLTFGGNTPLENPVEVANTIKYRSANPKDWKFGGALFLD